MSETEYSVNMLTDKQHEQQLRTQAVHLALQADADVEYLIDNATRIYEFIKGE